MEAHRAKTIENATLGLKVFQPESKDGPQEKTAREFLLEAMLLQSDSSLLETRIQLGGLQNGVGWKILKRLHPLGNFLFPENSWQKQLLLRSGRGLGNLLRRFKERKPGGVELNRGYQEWILNTEPTHAEFETQRKTSFAYSPVLSIITPVWNTPPQFLDAMIRSVSEQTYPNWELCLADGNSSQPTTREKLKEWAAREKRVRVRFLEENQGIAGNSNAALNMASGEFIALLDHDDLLSPFALFEIVKSLQDQKKNLDLLYSDEDMVNSAGTRRFSPVFKPAFSLETLRSHNYICHLTVIRESLVKEIGGFRTGFDGSQDYDLILRACEKARAIRHIPKILYHWRVHAGSTAGNPAAKSYAHEAGRKALQDHLARVGGNGQACHGQGTGIYQVVYHHPRWPKVSVIIPNRDQAETLRKCLESLDKETYPHWEFLILENGSTDHETFALYEQLKKDTRFRLLPWDQPFSYAAINNFGAAQATGEILLFLNNDVESLQPNNMRRMVEHALRDEVGIVGAALYYPDRTFQHAGVILGMTGIAGHYHRHAPEGSLGYGFRLATTRELSCVTGACLAMRKTIFQDLGGFDENLAIAFNDIDLCMQAGKKGLAVIWTPHAKYLHHESKTRGQEDTPEKQARFQSEIHYFKNKWGKELAQGDPFYSPNLSPDCETPKIRTVKE